MSPSEREPESSLAPSTEQHAGDPEPAAKQSVSDSVRPLLDAYDAFLDLQSQRLAPLATMLRTAIEEHDAALERLQRELPGIIERPWPEIVSYIATVRLAVVEALRDVSATLDPVGGCVAQWGEASAPAQSAIAALPKKDQQALSPLIPFWRAAATVVAHLQSGVTQWTRVTLDQISALDCAPMRALPEPASSDAADAPEPEVDVEVLFGAGAELRDRLGSASARLDAIADTVRQQLTSTVISKSDRLDAAFATEAEAASVDETAPGETAEQPGELWSDWFAQANARIELAGARLATSASLVDMHVEWIRDIDDNRLGGWAQAAHAAGMNIAEFRSRAEDIYRELTETGDGRRAIRLSTELFRDATRAFYQDYARHVDASALESYAAQRSTAALTHIVAQAGTLPESFLVHAIPEDPDSAVNPPLPSRVVTLRPVALSAIESTLAPALSAATDALGSFGLTFSEKVDDAQSVLRFHLGAAVEELREVSWRRRPDERRDQATAAARELTLAGLDRVSEALARQQGQIETCLKDISQALTEARHAIWQTVGSQVQAETTTQQLALKTRSTVSTSIRSVRRKLTAASLEVVQGLGRQTLALYRRLKVVLRYGRRAVIGDTTPIDGNATIDAIADLGTIRAGLPTVYRRLFSFYPLSDETLMAGREEDLVWLEKQLGLWRRGRTSACVLTSRPGCGLTSFINVARQRCFRGANVADIDLSRRVMQESVLVDLLIDALGIDTETEIPATLSKLADVILSGEQSSQLTVCVIEHLGHLFMRTIGGMELLGRLLRFLSETDSRIFWIATSNDFAWQLLTRNEPLALGLVTRYQISEYDRASLEEVIMRRHRRSGLAISFDPPAVISPFLRRRLRKANTQEEKQALLRGQFFDDLFYASGQNVMLALFYWHQAIAYHSDPASIQVRPLPKLSFDFLMQLSPPENFALKAFLEHASLTVDEYCQIANLNFDGGVEIFESLGNSMIIELVADRYTSVSDVDFDRIKPQCRYRVRPLLIQPVIRYLREKNIAH